MQWFLFKHHRNSDYREILDLLLILPPLSCLFGAFISIPNYVPCNVHILYVCYHVPLLVLLALCVPFCLSPQLFAHFLLLRVFLLLLHGCWTPGVPWP
jgi:hypothetical protein